MTMGWQSGERCFPSIEQAGAHACGQVFGMTNTGLLSCSGYSVSGNEVLLTLSSSATEVWVPQQCERLDWNGTWGPLFVVIVGAVITIACIRTIIGMFKKDIDA